MKRKHTTCYCSAYPYPHRTGGGECKEVEPTQRSSEFTQEDSNDQSSEPSDKDQDGTGKG